MGTVRHFYGSLNEATHTPSFFVSNSYHSEKTFAPTHMHDFGCLHFTATGVYQEDIENKRYEVECGQILYKPPGVEHCNEFRRTGAQICRIELHPSMLNDLALSSSPMQINNPRLSSLFQRIQRELSNADDLSPLCIEGLSWDVVCEIVRDSRFAKSALRESVAEEAAEMIRSDFPFPPAVSCLAEQLGVHRSQLARIFRRRFGSTITEFIRQLRVEKAMELLTHTDLSIIAVSLECGFVDQSHFTRCFRAATSTTPAKWRSDKRR